MLGDALLDEAVVRADPQENKQTCEEGLLSILVWVPKMVSLKTVQNLSQIEISQ